MRHGASSNLMVVLVVAVMKSRPCVIRTPVMVLVVVLVMVLVMVLVSFVK